jgi:hypothetical protein
MTCQYKVEGEMCVKDPNEVKWYDMLLLRWSKFLESDHKVTIEGLVKTQTNVLAGNMPNGMSLPKDASVQLVRVYECPMSSRGAAVIGLKGGLDAERKVREGVSKIYEVANEPEMRSFLEERWEAASEWVAQAVDIGIKGLAAYFGVPDVGNYSWLSRPLVKVGMKNLAKNFSEEAAEKYKTNQERLMSSKFKDGGLEAKEDSLFYKKIKSKDVDEAINFATCLNNLFLCKTYYIAAADGDITFGRDLKNDGPAYDCYMRNQDKLAGLPDKMFNLPTTSDEEAASGVFTRETLNVNAKLFDARQRKIGEVWRTDASVLNNFLHPDLKGGFSGEIFMKYVDDRKITLEQAGKNEKNSFNVRHLSLLTGASAQGTSLVYKEKGFMMRYSADDKDAKTRLDIYVDIDTGYIVKVCFEGRGKVEALPNLRLIAGWVGKGEITVSVNAEAVPSRLLSMKKL